MALWENGRGKRVRVLNWIVGGRGGGGRVLNGVVGERKR